MCIAVKSTYTIPKCLKFKIEGKDHNSQTQQYFIVLLIYYRIMGCMFQLPLESSSGPQDVDRDIQTLLIIPHGNCLRKNMPFISANMRTLECTK